MYCRIICWIAAFIASIGAINWGLVAFLNFNLVEYIQKMTGVEGLDKILYGIIAAAGVYKLIALFFCRH
jgi:uncharacterized membrane protein YuzA (DUF378 family)